jgi:acyltransferase
MAEPNSRADRISWVDTLRSTSILAIVVLHTGRVPLEVGVYTTSFFMPVFFFLSGLFVKESIQQQAFRPFVRQKIQRLLVPYLSFGIFSYGFWLAVLGPMRGDSMPQGWWDIVTYFLRHTLYGIGGYGWLNYNITLWFFPCLFVVELLFFGLMRLPDRRSLMGGLLLLSIVGYGYFEYFSAANLRLPFGCDIALTAVVFYGIGYLVQPYLFNPEFKAWHSPIAVVGGLIAYIVFSQLNQKSAFIVGEFGQNYAYFYLAALSGILFWTQCARLVKPNRVASAIGQNTLVIFPLHLLVFPVFTGILTHVFNIPKATIDNSSITGIAYSIGAILVLVPIAEALNRYAPFLLGKKSLSAYRPSFKASRNKL